jgi:myosin heavy subunit
MWKYFSIAAILCVVVSLWVANENKTVFLKEKSSRDKAISHYGKVQALEVTLDSKIQKRTQEIAALTEQEASLQAEQQKLTQEAASKDEELRKANDQLQLVKSEINPIQAQIDAVGNIDKLIAEVNELKEKEKSLEQAKALQEQKLSEVKASVEGYEQTIAERTEFDRKNRSGEIDPSFKAVVSQYLPQWGVVKIDKGNNQGVVSNAVFDIIRGKETIARAKVINVEPNHSMAEVVAGSIKEDTVINRGDKMIPTVSNAGSKPETTAAPAAETATASAEPAPASTEPAAAPTAAPSSEDPFKN